MTALPDDDPPLTLAGRADEEAVAAADRLFGGDFSAEAQMLFTAEAFRTTVHRAVESCRGGSCSSPR
jgi:hypothetical protein